MNAYTINNNMGVANEDMTNQVEANFDLPYSVVRYEMTSGPWHNILDAPGTDTWLDQGVYVAGGDHSPNGSAVAIQGSNEDLPQTEHGEKTVQKKKNKKNATKGDKKTDKNNDGPPRKDRKDGGDREGKNSRPHGHKSHGQAHRTQQVV